jgi:hypothetical protein
MQSPDAIATQINGAVKLGHLLLLAAGPLSLVNAAKRATISAETSAANLEVAVSLRPSLTDTHFKNLLMNVFLDVNAARLRAVLFTAAHDALEKLGTIRKTCLVPINPHPPPTHVNHPTT